MTMAIAMAVTQRPSTSTGYLMKTPNKKTDVVYQYRTSRDAVAREFLSEAHARQWHSNEMEKRPDYATSLTLFKVTTETTYQPL